MHQRTNGQNKEDPPSQTSLIGPAIEEVYGVKDTQAIFTERFQGGKWLHQSRPYQQWCTNQGKDTIYQQMNRTQ